MKKCRATRGKSPSPSLGALNINLGEGLRTIKHFQAVPQTLAARGSDKYPQNPYHRMIPQQEFNLWKPFPSRDNFNEVVTSLADRQQGLFLQQMAEIPSLSLPRRLLQIKAPQLLFPSRLLYNPQQEFNFWKPFPSWDNFNEVVTSLAYRQHGLFLQQMAKIHNLSLPRRLL